MNDQTTKTQMFDPEAAGWERVKAHNFGELVGPIYRRGDALFGFVASEKHGNHINIVHGGMLATFGDQSMGMTAQRATGNKPHVTIEFNIQFIGAVKIRRIRRVALRSGAHHAVDHLYSLDAQGRRSHRRFGERRVEDFGARLIVGHRRRVQLGPAAPSSLTICRSTMD